MYATLDKRSMQSLDFTFNRFFMKLFKTSNMEMGVWTAVKDCSDVTHQARYWNSILKNLLLLCDIMYFCCTIVKFIS